MQLVLDNENKKFGIQAYSSQREYGLGFFVAIKSKALG